MKLLPESAADQQAAQLALFQQRDSKFQHNWQNKRRKVMTESIFGGQQAAGSGDGASAGPGAAALHRLPALAAGGAPVAAGKQQAAKQQLQQRLLAVKRKKQLQQGLGTG